MLVTKYKVVFIEFTATVVAEEWLMLVPCYAENEMVLFQVSPTYFKRDTLI